MNIDSSKHIKLVSTVSSKFLNNPQTRVVPILRRGSVNKVFIVEARNTKLVVRMRDNNESLEEYEKEAWCIDKAAERRIPVATVFDMGIIDQHAYMIQPYIEGDEGRDSLFPRSHIWRQLGKYARLNHSIGVAGFGLKRSDLTQGNSRKSWLGTLITISKV
jgi:aminoglycoside phosphotransferase (APT) family kinase protein